MQLDDYKDEIRDKWKEIAAEFEDDPDLTREGMSFAAAIDKVSGLGIPDCFVGSYYCSSYKAKEAIKDLMFDEDFIDLCRWHGRNNIFFWFYQRPGDKKRLGEYMEESGLPKELGAEICDSIARAVIFFDMIEKGELNEDEEES